MTHYLHKESCFLKNFYFFDKLTRIRIRIRMDPSFFYSRWIRIRVKLYWARSGLGFTTCNYVNTNPFRLRSRYQPAVFGDLMNKYHTLYLIFALGDQHNLFLFQQWDTLRQNFGGLSASELDRKLITKQLSSLRNLHTVLGTGPVVLQGYFVVKWNKVRMGQCCGSMTFWCGSGSADPCLLLMDPDPQHWGKWGQMDWSGIRILAFVNHSCIPVPTLGKKSFKSTVTTKSIFKFHLPYFFLQLQRSLQFPITNSTSNLVSKRFLYLHIIHSIRNTGW